MPFAEHVRVTALGRLAQSGETFSYGINMAGTATNPGISGNVPIWDDIAEDIRAFHTHIDTRISGAAVLQGVKFALIGTDGKYVEDPYLAELPDSPGAAGQQANQPPQAALAITLDTARRGPSGRGRFYLPMPVITLEPATLRLQNTPTAYLATKVADLLNAMNNQPGLDSSPTFGVVVASTKGFNTRVTRVRIGDVVDTIRSRRAQLREVYTADVPAAEVAP